MEKKMENGMLRMKSKGAGTWQGGVEWGSSVYLLGEGLGGQRWMKNIKRTEEQRRVKEGLE